MKKIICLLLVFLLFSHVSVAGIESEAGKLLKRSVDKIFTVLSDEEMTMDQKKSKVIEITNPVFSFSLMAKLSLGKVHWSQFNTKQKTEFIDLYTKLFQNFYIEKLDFFSNETVVFQPATIVGKKKVQIQSALISKGTQYSMLYKMFKTGHGWKIYDLEIEGVSILRSYRSQYHHFLKKGGIEGLLAKMREIKENKER
ncbi:MAG: ABC transporter substrate-binding protein [Candidatus Brocadiales bacterium]|nr:ABC transporter substrate-binding protein [Candidatus Brocadiales bacterium]